MRIIATNHARLCRTTCAIFVLHVAVTPLAGQSLLIHVHRDHGIHTHGSSHRHFDHDSAHAPHEHLLPPVTGQAEPDNVPPGQPIGLLIAIPDDAPGWTRGASHNSHVSAQRSDTICPSGVDVPALRTGVGHHGCALTPLICHDDFFAAVLRAGHAILI